MNTTKPKKRKNLTRKMVSVYADPPVWSAIIELSKRTRVPAAVLVREALDDLLKKYKVRPKVGVR